MSYARKDLERLSNTSLLSDLPIVVIPTEKHARERPINRHDKLGQDVVQEPLCQKRALTRCHKSPIARSGARRGPPCRSRLSHVGPASNPQRKRSPSELRRTE